MHKHFVSRIEHTKQSASLKNSNRHTNAACRKLMNTATLQVLLTLYGFFWEYGSCLVNFYIVFVQRSIAKFKKGAFMFAIFLSNFIQFVHNVSKVHTCMFLCNEFTYAFIPKINEIWTRKTIQSYNIVVSWHGYGVFFGEINLCKRMK